MPEPRSADELLRELRASVRRDPLLAIDAEPRFNFHIGWCNNYDELLSMKCETVTEIDELVTRAMTFRRVLIHARGGGAKTAILRRLIREYVPSDVLPIWLDLKRWTVADYKSWDNLATLPMKVDFLLERLAVPRIAGAGIALLEALPVRIGKMLFVDGLNEILTGVATEMLEALHGFVRAIPASAVIVSDRLVRRVLKDSETWRLATVMPLDEAQIKFWLSERFGSAILYDKTDAQTRTLLTVPYFLDAALREGQLATSGPGVHEQYFIRHVLTADELTRVARAAFDAYWQNRTRSFSLASFRAAVGDDTFEKLRRETLVVHGENAHFDHHLKHDYLAAVHLAGDRDLWNEDVFNHLTFWASSFEVLAMALDLLDAEAKADAFVQAVYDWNPYGAAYAVAEGRYRGRPRVSPHMEMILLAVIAERQWDLIATTAERSRDALRLFGTQEAQRMLEASSLEDVCDYVRGVPRGDEGFERWRRLFTRSRGTTAHSGDVDLLTKDSIMGWTAANVLKRLKLSKGEQQEVRRLTGAPSSVVRWRAVHVLGAFPTEANARILLAALDADKHSWVRYGAIRSVIEVAARGDGNLRRWILNAIAERAEAMLLDKPVEQELQNAVLIDRERAPKEWSALIITMVGKIRAKEHLDERRDRWEDLAYKIKATYEANSQA